MSSDQALSGEAARFIFEWFVVSEFEANRLASECVDLIQANGGDPTLFTSEQLRPLIVRRLAETHEWPDERQKQRAALEREKNTKAYERFIEKGRPSPFKKW